MRIAAEFGLMLIAVLAAIALGAAAVVIGESDDSPGLQGIGVIVVVGATVAALRWRGRSLRDEPSREASSAGDQPSRGSD